MNKSETVFYLPFVIKNHNNESKEITCNIQWLRDIGLVSKPEVAKLVASTSSEYVRCSYSDLDRNTFRDVVDFASWLCVMDDIMDRDNALETAEDKIELLSTIKFICEHDLEYSEPINDRYSLARSFIDAKNRLKNWLSTASYWMVLNNVNSLLSGIIWEISSHHANKSVNLNTCCMIKTTSSSPLVAFALSLAMNDINSDISVVHKKEFVTMMNCVLLVIAIDNDLYSLEKEMAGEKNIFNIVHTIHKERDLDLVQAASKAVSLRNEYLSRYIALRDALSAHFNMRSYAECFEGLMAGNVYIGHTCERYVGKGMKGKAFNMDFFSSASCDFEISAIAPKRECQDIIDLIPSVSWWLK